jgi:hypothetical protein
VPASSTTPSMRRVRVREYIEASVGEIESVCFSALSLYCEDGVDDDDEEDGVGRFLWRCWLRGMPRCAAR